MVGVHNRKTLKLLIWGLKTEKLDDVIQSICIYIEHKNGPRPELREQPSLLDGSHFQHSFFQLRT